MAKSSPFFVPQIVIFVSSMGIMIIELVASRIISKYFGNSLYTWTGIIGVVLGGITLGNYLGGKIADRFPIRKAAPVLLLTASGLTLLILILDFILMAAMDRVALTNPVGLVLAAVSVITLMFFLPSTALGTISPVMAKYALEQSSRIGHTVGNIYASSAAGSIVGTFLSGFILVPFLGIRTVIFVVALTIASLTLLISGPKKMVFGWLSVLGLLFFLIVAAPAWGFVKLFENEKIIYQTDSMYSNIQVKEENSFQRDLIMDGLVHNMHDLKDPDNLLYEYEKIFEAVTNAFILQHPEKSNLKTLTLGGGALTFPSYLERHNPRGEHHVVEIDPAVMEVAHRFFDISEDTALVRHVQDARQFTRNVSGYEKFDIVYLDVFDSYSIPYHLTTLEYTRQLKTLLKDNGILLVNLIDIFSIGRFLGAYTATVGEVFPYSAVYTGKNFREEGRSTFVLLAAQENPELNNSPFLLEDRYAPISDERLITLRERTSSRPLTDNYAPVENLIAPVFLDIVK